MKPGLIYLDICITSPVIPEVLEAMQPYFTGKFWYPGTFVSTEKALIVTCRGSRKLLLRFGSDPAEIHFTREALWKQYSHQRSAAAAPGKHAICMCGDYPDLLTNAAYLEKQALKLPICLRIGKASSIWSSFALPFVQTPRCL